MTTLHRYVARLFLQRFLLVLFGVSFAILAFEMVEAAGDLGGDAAETATLARYAMLRLPSFLAQLLPIATLIASLLTVAELHRQREQVALWGAGLSQARLLYGLLPLALLLGGAQFLLNDQVTPRTAEQLRAWGVGEFRAIGLLSAGDGTVWLRSGNDIVRVSAEGLEADRLTEITVFRRDGEGLLVDRLDAAEARREGDGWELLNVTIHDIEPYGTSHSDSLYWDGRIELENLRLVARPPRELSLADLWDLYQSDGYGQRPVELYSTWINARLAQFFAAPLVFFLAFSLGQRWKRTGELVGLLAGGLALGFGFFILDGAAVALGEVGFLPAPLAAWALPLLLACLVAHLLLKPEAAAPITLALSRER